MKAAILALLLLGPGQDLEELVRRLSDEAVDALADLGPERLPELRSKLDGLEPEARTRLAEAIGRIEEAAWLLKVLPPVRPVSLDFTNTPGRKALEEWSKQTGMALDLDRMPDAQEVTLRVENLPPLEALNRICREAMVGWRIRGKEDWRGRRTSPGPERIEIHRVVPYYHRVMPAAYVRHYYVRASEPASDVVTSVSVWIQTAPGVRPHSVSGLRILAAEDENGRDLRAALVPAFEGVARLREGETEATCALNLRAPDPRPLRIARLEASVTFLYPRELRWIRLVRGMPVDAAGCRFALEKYVRMGTAHEVEITFSRIDGPGTARDLERELPFAYTEIELLTPGGERLHSAGCSGTGGPDGWHLTLSMQGSKDEDASEIRFPWAERFVEDEVRFELRDILLRRPPRQGR